MSSIVRSPGGQLVPYDRVDQLSARTPTSPPSNNGGAVLDLLTDLAQPLRDYYCSVAPTAPINNPPYTRTPNSLTSAVNRAICANSANPLPPQRGQCPGVVYDVLGVVVGFDTNGLPYRANFTSVGVTGLWGEVLNCRIAGFAAGRWNLEVFCRGSSSNAINPPGVFVWRGIGSTGGPNRFSSSFGATVESWYAVRRDGLPDNCAIAPTPVPLPDPGSQVLILPRTDPTIQRYFDIDVPVTIQERGQPLSLDIELPDAVIQVDFNMDGMTFSVEGSEIDLDLDVGGITQQIQNTENNLSLEIENQNNIQNQFIQQQNQELSLQLQTEFALELQTQLGDLNVTAEVDFSPVLIAIDNLGNVVRDTCDCEPCDLTPVLDRLNELDEKFSLRLDELEEGLHEKLQEILDKARCYFSELYPAVAIPQIDSIVNVGNFSATHEVNVARFDVSGAAIAVGVVVTGFDEKIIRAYKFTNPESEIEAGFGHVSVVLQGRVSDFELLSTRDKILVFPPTKLQKGIRVSLKPGTSVQVFAILGVIDASECLE